eukprot:1159957-Pelagomonas_calceolata.AAC.21
MVPFRCHAGQSQECHKQQRIESLESVLGFGWFKKGSAKGFGCNMRECVVDDCPDQQYFFHALRT